MTTWTVPAYAGLLPQIFLASDPRPAEEQANDRYSYGGGWINFDGFVLADWKSVGRATIAYPGDPLTHEETRAFLPQTQETLILFSHSWLAIVQRNGSYKIARMD